MKSVTLSYNNIGFTNFKFMIKKEKICSKLELMACFHEFNEKAYNLT